MKYVHHRSNIFLSNQILFEIISSDISHMQNEKSACTSDILKFMPISCFWSNRSYILNRESILAKSLSLVIAIPPSPAEIALVAYKE